MGPQTVDFIEFVSSKNDHGVLKGKENMKLKKNIGVGLKSNRFFLDIWRNTCNNFRVIREGVLKLSSRNDSGGKKI